MFRSNSFMSYPCRLSRPLTISMVTGSLPQGSSWVCGRSDFWPCIPMNFYHLSTSIPRKHEKSLLLPVQPVNCYRSLHDFPPQRGCNGGVLKRVSFIELNGQCDRDPTLPFSVVHIIFHYQYMMAMICRRYHSPTRRHRQPCQIDAKFGNHLHLYLDLPFAATLISYCAPETTNPTLETYILNTIIPFYATLHIHRVQSPFTMAPTTSQPTNLISDFMPLLLPNTSVFSKARSGAARWLLVSALITTGVGKEQNTILICFVCLKARVIDFWADLAFRIFTISLTDITRNRIKI